MIHFNIFGIFHDINHPAIGVSHGVPFMETSTIPRPSGPGYAKQVVRDLVRHLDTNLDGNIDKNELNEKEIDEAIQRGIAGCGA